jgi:hypothetical protein
VAQFAPESLAQFAPDLVAQFDRNIHLTEANQRGYLMMYQTKRNYLMEK